MERVWHRVGTQEEIEAGRLRRAQVGGVRWVGLYVFEGQVYALEDVCPHWGVPLTEGCVLPSGHVECALHGWTFDLASGCGLDAEMGAVDRFDVEVRDGEVWIAEAPRSEGSGGGTLRGSGL